MGFIQDPTSFGLLPCLISHSGCPSHLSPCISEFQDLLYLSFQTPFGLLSNLHFFFFFFLLDTLVFSEITSLFSLIFLLELKRPQFSKPQKPCHAQSLWWCCLIPLHEFHATLFLVQVSSKPAASTLGLVPARSRLQRECGTSGTPLQPHTCPGICYTLL